MLDDIAWDGAVIGEWWTVSDVQGGGRRLSDVTSCHLIGGTEENHDPFRQDSRCASRD